MVSPSAGGEGGSGRGPLLKICPNEDTAVSVTMDTCDSRTILPAVLIVMTGSLLCYYYRRVFFLFLWY